MAVSSPGIATLSFTAISGDMAISLLMARVPVAGQTPKLAANWRPLNPRAFKDEPTICPGCGGSNILDISDNLHNLWCKRLHHETQKWYTNRCVQVETKGFVGSLSAYEADSREV